MLERVSNINFNSNLNDSKKGRAKDSYLKSVMRSYHEHDALHISQGLKELNRHNVKLNKFKKLDQRFIEISFVLGNLEFNTTLNVESLSNYITQRYDLKPAAAEQNFTLSLLTKTIYIDDAVNYQLSVKSINYLIERIVSLDIKAELNASNTRALSNLFDNIYNGVLDEFISINSLLMKVVSDVVGMPILKGSEDDLGNEIILIEKIVPDYAD